MEVLFENNDAYERRELITNFFTSRWEQILIVVILFRIYQSENGS